MSANRLFWPVALILITMMGAVQVWTARGESQTWDEAAHIWAGYAYLTWGDYRWNPEHPPLVKMMSALPLLALKPSRPADSEAGKPASFQVGIDFLYKNRVPAGAMLFAARSMTILLTLCFGLALAWWTRRRFGAAAGLAALGFYAADPNLIAHGRYVTTDVPFAAFFFLFCVLWTDYLLSGRFRDLALAAAAFALAVVTKFSAAILIPILIGLYFVRWIQVPKEFSRRRLVVAAATLFTATVLAVNVAYWPETMRCLRDNVPPLKSVVDRDTLTGKILYPAARWLHLPSHAFLYGLNVVASHNQRGHVSYLLGMRSDKGWWYYFPVVLAVKSTIAMLLLIALALGAALWRSRQAIPFVWIGLLFPPIFYFVVSMTSGINLGVRHILPIYPLFYVAAAAILTQPGSKRIFRYALFTLAGLQIAECGSIYPDYLAFFNALSGGPGNGPRYLVDSNLDWGQDAKKLAEWLAARGTRRVRIKYFGTADLRYYGIDAWSLPAMQEPKSWQELDGFAAASVTPLYGVYAPLEELAPLRRMKPIAKIGYSIYVYDFGKPKTP